MRSADTGHALDPRNHGGPWDTCLHCRRPIGERNGKLAALDNGNSECYRTAGTFDLTEAAASLGDSDAREQQPMRDLPALMAALALPYATEDPAREICAAYEDAYRAAAIATRSCPDCSAASGTECGYNCQSNWLYT